MASVRSFSDILLTTPDLEPDKRDRFLRIIQNESIRLTRLLDDILDLNQIENGSPEWEMSPFDPEQAIDQAMESCEALARAGGVTLIRSARARKALVYGNRDKLAQVFINLISNAIKYNTSRDPTVTIAGVLRKGTYEARVSDNGPGIPESERPRIFTKFARGPMPRQVGAGLGLAISRQIVERLGGTLSLAEGKATGAEFVLTLQTVSSTRAQPAAESA
jgi:signal transduction histidine kinase